MQLRGVSCSECRRAGLFGREMLVLGRGLESEALAVKTDHINEVPWDLTRNTFQRLETAFLRTPTCVLGPREGISVPTAPLVLACLKGLMSSLLLFFVAMEQHSGTGKGESFYTYSCYLTLSTTFKENYIPSAVAAISLGDGNHHGNQGCLLQAKGKRKKTPWSQGLLHSQQLRMLRLLSNVEKEHIS